MQKKILITGGSGFIGSCLAEKLIKDPGNFVVIVDNLSTGALEKLPNLPKDNWRFLKCDVNDYHDIAEVMLSYNFDYVFHYSAFVGVQRTQANPISVLNDLKGIENVFSLCKNSSVRRVFFASSSEVYGEPVDLPQNEETTPLNSRIPYAVVKNVAEAFLTSYKKEYDLDFTIFRFFNTYGPKQSPDFVMSKFIKHALLNEDVPIYGTGEQTRTFCYIDDNVDACINSLKYNKYINEVVNIGCDKEISILDLAKAVIKIAGSKSKIVFKPPLPEGDMKRRYPDIRKMRNLIKRELISLEEGIMKTLEDVRFIIS